MGDRFRPPRNRLSSGTYHQDLLFVGPDAERQRHDRPYFDNDAGVNDRPLQFNGNHMPGELAMMDVYNNPRYGPNNIGIPLMGPMALQEVIQGNGYVVFPPDGTTPTPIPSERPVGCKTVVFSDVPFELTGDMVLDLCERIAGSVDTFKRANGPFCEIRFCDQGAVDRIFAVHGMHVCVNHNESPAFSGRLLVDYVKNSCDLREYELEQRRIMRELRHEEANAETLVVEFTRPYIDEVTERIKEETIAGGCVNILLTWLERGNCNKKTASTFYRLISLTNSHVKRLQNEKIQVEDCFEQARQQYISSKDSIVTQLTLIEQVFTSAAKKKVWDHFTKPQRKSLDVWSQAVKELRSQEEKELRPEVEVEADMEIDSEEEDVARRYPPRGKRARRPRVISNEVLEVIDLSDDEDVTELLMEEARKNYSETAEQTLEEKQQVESTESEGTPPEKRVKVNEMESTEIILEETDITVRTEEEEEAEPEQEQSQDEILTDETEVQEISELGEEEEEEDTEIPESKMEENREIDMMEMAKLRKENRLIKTRLDRFKKEEASMREKETQIKALQLAFVNMQQQLREAKSKLKNEEENRKVALKTAAAAGVQQKTIQSLPGVSTKMSRTEGALMSFMCIFLHAHPFGASIEYLYSYLSRLHPDIVQSDIDKILHRYTNCFVQELSGVGASLERRWKFVAFEHAMKNS